MILILLILSTMAYAQNSILENPEIQQKIESCLAHTYNYNFEDSRNLLKQINNDLPEHPVADFLNALIIYWENMPLLPQDDQTEAFIKSMERSQKKAKALLRNNPRHIEGVFFDLHTRAFTAMFWADNGKPARVIRDIDNLYRRTMIGIDMKEKFNEFYFSSGLYSYYIDAYLDAHPVYKPIAALFRQGDMEKGLRELQYAIDNTTYIKVEAILFMSLLQLNYEKDMVAARKYASLLYDNFPNNTYYTGHYLMILLYEDEFELVDSILPSLEARKDNYSQMLYNIYGGFLAENRDYNQSKAKELYRLGIEEAERIGAFADIYRAIAYAGLSRIQQDKGNQKLAKKHRKRSATLSKYEFILSYR